MYFFFDFLITIILFYAFGNKIAQRVLYLYEMKINLKKIAFVFFVLLMYAETLEAQQQFTDEKRAEYIINASDQVVWPDSVLQKKFTIAILGDEDSLLFYLNKIRKEKDSIQGLPFKIVSLKNFNNLQSANVVYLHSHSGFNVDDLYQMVKGKHILIIGENYEFQSTMIGLIEVNGRRRFTVNKELLDSEGFKVPPLFMALAIKSREQMENEYKKSLQVLRDEQAKVVEHRREIKRQKLVIDSQSTEIEKQINQLKALKNNVRAQEILLAKRLEEMEKQGKRIDEQKAILNQQLSEIDKQESEIGLQRSQLSSLLEKIKIQKIILILSIIFIILSIALIFFIYRGYRIKKESNRKLHEKNEAIELRNAEILMQKEEIQTQRDQIEEQRDILSEQRQEILDSIQYAKRIQEAVLTPEEILDEIMPQHFIIYHPRNIVSGDYYWAKQKGDETIVVAADCTGHGVPGAFMSMLGVSFLNEIVSRIPVLRADIILNELRTLVINSLHQKGHDMEQKDGMDMELCIVNRITGKLQFAGANNPLFIVREKVEGKSFDIAPNFNIEEMTLNNNKTYQLLQIKADKMPIGIYIAIKPFTVNEINIYPEDKLYMFSDGYIDQFGGSNGRKFMSKRLKETLLSIADRNLEEQRVFLEKTLSDWMQGWEQVDDILLMGLQI
jgi:serine phosphatase RsbU (regulator of sigma subunit)